jgi:hypothetical protein
MGKILALILAGSVYQTKVESVKQNPGGKVNL